MKVIEWKPIKGFEGYFINEFGEVKSIRTYKGTKETQDNCFEHHKYLSTHTFYSEEYEWSSKLLQSFGFNIELDNWG